MFFTIDVVTLQSGIFGNCLLSSILLLKIAMLLAIFRSNL